jgi:MIP family channel proteins
MIDGLLLRRALAELVGAFGLVFAGTGAIIINAESGGEIGQVGIGVTFGLIIMVMIYATGHISGAHFNPAVTLAFAAVRHFPLANVPVYIAAQLAGAILASALLRGMFGNVASLGATLPAGSDGQSFVLEIVLTFFLMFVIIAVATDVRAVVPGGPPAAAIAIGGTVGLEAIFGGPISGASMNPARSLAPALVSGAWESQWLYIVGPIAGALAGAFVYMLIRAVPEEKTA